MKRSGSGSGNGKNEDTSETKLVDDVGTNTRTPPTYIYAAFVKTLRCGCSVTEFAAFQPAGNHRMQFPPAGGGDFTLMVGLDDG